ncbi:NADH dehydrogenase [ubiquinone] 1 beta subcomplex subunit 8, mitochondrial-like [Vespa mandarinia]|uniref:NADH dehydrogenase [ubiquinone] 1 beta subcomplex subunit 8, mitochondrial-like n=1 Tax=Vespa mandarinia TaxID=7446 RepID=UPI00161D28B6|nr:NADH dehydrogenase [ubiquinone] 1 beta subcomplex subunit 8, mitochondrial-like [Vespa mandarinia]
MHTAHTLARASILRLHLTISECRVSVKMVLIKNCMTLTRTILLSRNNANLHVKVNYSQEIKPYLYKWRAKKDVPTTEEEIKEAAEKYNLHPREYKAYEPDGFGFGDYPKLPYIGADARDPYYPWDFPEFRRNFNEPVHIEEDQIGEDRYAAGVRTPLSGLEVVLMFVGTMTTLGIVYWIFEYYPWFQCVMQKQYPKAGVTHYTFESLR